MKWLARNPEDRCNPASLLPGAASVICLALRYGENGIDNTNGPADGRRARFARGRDYHAAVRERLERLADFILRERPDVRARICVDTSPILEKALAERAGLGMVGRHTILVNREIGSWFVLGLVITDMELKPDAPARDRCGDCLLCVKSCPTGALTAPRRLDARRCISYLTIEVKDNSPERKGAIILEGAYGCDICQEVCPLNKGAFT